MEHLCSLVLALLLLAVSAAAEERVRGLRLAVILDENTGTIGVKFINTTMKPVRIWQSWNSWGWGAMTLVVRRKGKTYGYRQDPEMTWTRNGPSYEDIPAGASFTEKIDLKKLWVATPNAPLLFKKSDQISVVYCVAFTQESDRLHVWTGIAAGQNGE